MNTLSQFSAATIHEALGKKGALPHYLRPLDPSIKMSGTAFVVQLMEGDNYMLHYALKEAPTGSIVVAAIDGSAPFGYWGEIMTRSALKRNIKGLVIEGCIRDVQIIRQLKFPVFSSGIHIQGTAKENQQSSSIETSISLGQTTINNGDIVIGDEDGLVAVPAKLRDEVIEKSLAIEAREKEVFDLINVGKTTFEIFNL